MLNLVKEVRNEILDREECKIVVHCSEGSGRTGTFIALYRLMEIMDERLQQPSIRNNFQTSTDATSTANQMVTQGIDVFETVLNLRRKRMQMVSKHGKPRWPTLIEPLIILMYKYFKCIRII